MTTERISRPTDEQISLAASMAAAGIFTINEVRAVIDLPPISYGGGLAVIPRKPASEISE